MLPEGHKQWIEQVLARYDVPKLPDTFVPRIDTLLGWSESGGRSHVEIALKHPIRLLVNALGPPPKDVIDRAHQHGVKVAALVGSVAQAQQAGGAGRRRDRGPGLGGRRPHRRRLQHGADPGGGRRRLAGAGARRRRDRLRAPGGGRARARRPGRLDRIDLAHGGRGRSEPGADGEAAARDLARHRAHAQHDGQAGAPAAHALDGGLGRPGVAGAAADAAPVHAQRGCAGAHRPLRAHASARARGSWSASRSDRSWAA